MFRAQQQELMAEAVAEEALWKMELMDAMASSGQLLAQAAVVAQAAVDSPTRTEGMEDLTEAAAVLEDITVRLAGQVAPARRELL